MAVRVVLKERGDRFFDVHTTDLEAFIITVRKRKRWALSGKVKRLGRIPIECCTPGLVFILL